MLFSTEYLWGMKEYRTKKARYIAKILVALMLVFVVISFPTFFTAISFIASFLSIEKIGDTPKGDLYVVFINDIYFAGVMLIVSILVYVLVKRMIQVEISKNHQQETGPW
jgi:hypothetical protein